MNNNATCCTCGKAKINPDTHRCIPELKAEIAHLADKLYKAEAARNGWMKNYDAKNAEIARLKGEVEEARAQNKELRAELDKWAKSVFARDLAACRKELDAERGKVERLEKSAEEHPPHDDKCKCDFCYFARLLRQILTGEG